MKKLLAVLLAAVLVLSFAACGNNKDKVVRYDVPEGYEIFNTYSGDSSYAVGYAVMNDTDDMLYGIAVIIQAADSNVKKGLRSKKISEAERYLDIEFDESLSVDFVKHSGFPGMKITAVDESGIVNEISYNLLAGDWSVVIYTECEPEFVDRVHSDMQTILNSLRLEEFIL